VLIAARPPVEVDMCVACVQFAQILFSLTAFVLLPFTCKHIKQQSPVLFTAVMAIALLSTSMLLATFSWQMASMYLALHVCLVFVCPWWLLHIEKFKAKINGPWDEAVPKLTKMVRESSIASSSAKEIKLS
jgi:phosphatidylinositol N-acetylglucosaminyltransferase subunit C